MNKAGLKDAFKVDDEINMVQRQYIQPVAKIPGDVLHTTTEADEELDVATDIAADVYRLNFIRDITINERGTPVPLLMDSKTSAYGARYHNGMLFLSGVQAERDLFIAYYRRLSPLGEGAGEVIVPEIPEQWHDLYWMGAAAMIVPERFYQFFVDRLREFERERTRETRPLGSRMNVRGWWRR